MMFLTTLTTWQHPVTGRVMHIVINPMLAEPNDLCGQEICLNGTVVTVEAVETYQIARPYPPDWNIGLLVSLQD